jgi:hypothetical protein
MKIEGAVRATVPFGIFGRGVKAGTTFETLKDVFTKVRR